MSPADGSIMVLLVDEDKDYLNLIKRILDRIPEFSVETTPNPAEALKIIDDSPVDAVVSYYQMSQISGLELLRIVRERRRDLPFILLTGKSREDVAIEALNLGADFYLQKGLDQLQITELTNVIKQAVKRRQAEQALRDSETLYRLILDSSPVAISVNVEGTIVYANQKRAELTGHKSPQELIGQDSLQTVHPDDFETIRELQRKMKRGERLEPNFNYKAVTKQGETRYVETNLAEIVWEGQPALLFFSRDVTAHERSRERQQVYTRRLEALYRMTEAVVSTSTIDEIAKLVETAAKEIIGYDLGSLALVEEGALHHRYVWGVKLNKEYVLPLDGPGITVRVVRTGEAQLVKDAAAENDFVNPDEVGVILSELAVPVKVGGEVVAVINVESREKNAFGEDEHKLLSILGDYAGSAIHSIRLLENMQGFTEKLEALHRSSTRLAVAGTREEVYDIALNIMGEDLNYTWAGVGLVEDGYLKYIRYTGGTLEGDNMAPLDGPGVTVRAVKTGSTQLVKDTRLDPGYMDLEGYKGPYLSELAVPVTVDDRVMLVLNLESSRVDDFNENDVRLMELLARHITVALQNIRSTGERRHYEERLEALSWAMASMSMAESLEQLADQTLDIIEEIIAAPYSMYMLVEGDTLVTVKTRGAPLLGTQLPINGKSVTARAAREKKPILVRDTRLDPGFVKGSMDSLSELAVPVIVDDKVVGVLNMESLDVGYFNISHVSLADALSAHAASNLERLWRDQQMLEAQRRAIEERERAEQAERLEEMKTNFIRTATHEIRTPLTSIKGYAELAQALMDREGSPTLANYFDAIMRNTERLEKLTSNMLDVQRIESGQIELNREPLQVKELLSEATAELEPILRRRSQRLTVSGEDATVTADSTRLMQVLINLAVNASKFSPENSDIRINVEHVGDEIQVSVTDTGVGIRAEDIPKLFTPFSGIHIEGVSSGTGLGLSICKGIVELHGGRIWAESEGSGKGSTFTFTLPKLGGGVDV